MTAPYKYPRKVGMRIMIFAQCCGTSQLFIFSILMNSLLKHATPNVPNGADDMDNETLDLICWAIWLSRLVVNLNVKKNLNSTPLPFRLSKIHPNVCPNSWTCSYNRTAT